MFGSLTDLRRQYFAEVAASVPTFSGQLVVLTHVLHDRPELLAAFASIAPIAVVIAIPYSTNPDVLLHLRRQYPVVTPTLEELGDAAFLRRLILQYVIDPPVMIVEIGGYFAKAINQIREDLQGQILGVVEDTEIGHREYGSLRSLPCPVISVAHSSLKETEDFLIGSSCLYSTERLLRDAGYLLEGQAALVLGFGKVGGGLASALSRRQCPVMVFDVDPIRRVKALSEGFQVLGKQQALQRAEIVFGATGQTSIAGNDFHHLGSGTVLVSCSSRDIEFDLRFLNANYDKTKLFENFDFYESEGHSLYLLGGGTPVNFIDGAVIGPILSLVQGEIILSMKWLIDGLPSPGLYEVDKPSRQWLADKWLKYFHPSEIFAHDAADALS